MGNRDTPRIDKQILISNASSRERKEGISFFDAKWGFSRPSYFSGYIKKNNSVAFIVIVLSLIC